MYNITHINAASRIASESEREKEKDVSKVQTCRLILLCWVCYVSVMLDFCCKKLAERERETEIVENQHQ